MSQESMLRFGAQTDETTSLLRVVNLVRTGTATTRPEIGRLTGLGRGVVSQRIERAIEIGFLEEGEVGASSGGRAPRTLHFRHDRGKIAVCALGALHMSVGIADLNGALEAHEHRDWDIAQGPAATIDEAEAALRALLATVDDAPVWAVVVGLPGPVDFATGKPVAPPIMPGWNGFDVRRSFANRFEAPVWVDNDVNLLALAERKSRGTVDLVYCKVGSGIGAGILSRGALHRGANGAAGDIGHVQAARSEEACRCGKTGCLEAVAGGWALVRDAHRAIADGETSVLSEGGDPITPVRIARAAEDGDALSIRLIQHSARVMGAAIATLVNVLNPNVIVVGGAVAAAGEIFLAEVRQRVYELAVPLASRDLQLVNSRDDTAAPVHGGIELAIDQLFDLTFPRWFAQGKPPVELTSTAR